MSGARLVVAGALLVEAAALGEEIEEGPCRFEARDEGGVFVQWFVVLR